MATPEPPPWLNPGAASKSSPRPIAASSSGAAPPVMKDYSGGGGGEKKKKPRSLWNQFSDVATGVVPGILRLGKNVGTEVIAPPRMLYDLARGDLSLGEFGAASGGGGSIAAALAGADKQPDLYARYHPITSQQGESFINTGKDIIHPTRFARAVEEGTIVDKILEDTGNISMVAGPVAKGLAVGSEAASAAGYARTGAALDKAATVAQYTHSVTGPIANAPISIPRRLFTGATEGTRLGINALAEGSGPFSETANRIRDRAPLAFSEKGGILKEGLKTGNAAASRAVARAQRAVFAGGLVDKDPAMRPTLAEQGAATAILSGVGHADQIMGMNNPHLSGEDVRQGHVLTHIDEQTYTPEVADVTRQYLSGNYDPARVPILERYMNTLKSEMQKSAEAALSGEGRLGGPLDPKHVSNLPLDDQVLNALREAADDPTSTLGVTPSDVDALEQLRAGGDSWEDIAAAHPAIDEVLKNPNVWPKRWRPAMRAMALGNENLGGPELGYRPEDLMAHGMPEPTYFSSARSELAQPSKNRVPSERTNLGMGGLQGLSSEHRSFNAERLPYSARTAAEALGHEARRTTLNQHLLNALQTAKIPSIADILGNTETRTIVDAAKKEAKANNLSVFQTRQLVGQRLTEALEVKGHSPVIGDLNQPKPGDFDAGATVKLEDVRPDTPAFETNVKGALVPRYATQGGGVIGGGLDWVNRKFKSNVLPLSIRWQLGDAVGGAMMAYAGGGIDPITLAKSMRELKHLDPVAQQQLFEHPDFADASLSQGERQVINLGPDAPEPKTIIGKAKRASFRLNNKINDMNRHGYLLAKTNELLSEHGLSVDQLGGDEAAWAQPEVQQSLTAAVKDATKVMGSFDEMSPREQRYMKRIFPFWAWNRHITQLAWHMAVDNPARALWTARLGSYGSDPNSDLPSWLKGGIPLPFGGLSIPTSGLNPFNDIIGGEPFYTPPGLMRSMSPGIKLGVAALTGADLNRGLAQFTRPRGTTGAGGTTPLALRPLELGYQAAKTLPFSRVAMDLLPTKTIDAGRAGKVSFGPVARYGSGARIAKYGTTPRWQKALPLFGVPLMPTPKTKG